VQTIAFMPQSMSAIVRPFSGLAREFHFYFRHLQILVLVWITALRKNVETKTGSGEVQCRQSETERFSSERLEDEIETKRPEVAAKLEAWGTESRNSSLAQLRATVFALDRPPEGT
jgi:hypothetical protein